MRAGTTFGKLAGKYIEKGQLVPDELTSQMFLQHLPNPDHVLPGVVLDGFPRTLGQAKKLDEVLLERGHVLDLIVNIEVPLDQLVRRISTRRICTTCGAVYNAHSKPPGQRGRCDIDGGALIQRLDDSEAVLPLRLQEYCQSHEGLVKFYTSYRKVAQVDGTQPILEVSKEIANLIRATLDASGCSSSPE